MLNKKLDLDPMQLDEIKVQARNCAPPTPLVQGVADLMQ
jgi:hypothetical protein